MLGHECYVWVKGWIFYLGALWARYLGAGATTKAGARPNPGNYHQLDPESYSLHKNRNSQKIQYSQI